MKTLKSIILLVVAGFITMSMGFPTDLADKTNEEKKPCPDYKTSQVVVMAKANTSKSSFVLKNTKPVQKLNIPSLSGETKITLKVFDIKGILVLKQQVSMNSFLSRSELNVLPDGSTFVMFHENTAYYFLETNL